MEEKLRNILLETAASYASATSCAMSTVARNCKNDSSFFERLHDTSKSFTIRTYDEVMAWFLVNWPAEQCCPNHLRHWAKEFKSPMRIVDHDQL